MAADKLTPKQFWKEIDKLQLLIQRRTTTFPNDTAEKQRKRVERAEGDFFFFARTYFPHYVDVKFGRLHYEWLNKSGQVGHIWANIAARHHGKTVLLAIIKPVWEAVYKRKRFVVFISENRDLAQERTVAIRLEFLHNGRIRHDFGEQVRPGQGEEQDFNIKLGCRFLAQGYKQPIRGKLHGRNRPDYCIIDDLEGHTATNPRIATEKLRYVREDLYGALDKDRGNVVWLGNLTSRDSALQMFVDVVDKDKPAEMSYGIYPALRPNGKPAWPQMFSIADLERIKRVMGTAGFQRHMMMIPVVEGTVIKHEWFKYLPRPTEFSRIVIVTDPSLGDSKHSDYKAIVTLAIHGKRYHILDLWIRKATVEAMFSKWYELHERFKVPVTCEGGLWQDVLWPMLEKSEAFQKAGYIVPVRRIVNSVKKEVRIETLQPLYERGLIVHYPERDDDLNRLEDQLLSFPHHPHDDGPDALAMAVSQLHRSTVSHKCLTQPRSFNMNDMP